MDLKTITAKDLMEHQRQIRSQPASQKGIDKIWIVMAGIFGTKWTNSMGADPSSKNGQTWRAVMRGVTDDQIDKGLVAFSDTGSVFIPAATEFKDLCRYEGRTREQAAFDKLASRKPYRALTDEGKKGRAEKAGRSAIDEMKSTLNKG